MARKTAERSRSPPRRTYRSTYTWLTHICATPTATAFTSDITIVRSVDCLFSSIPRDRRLSRGCLFFSFIFFILQAALHISDARKRVLPVSLSLYLSFFFLSSFRCTYPTYHRVIFRCVVTILVTYTRQFKSMEKSFYCHGSQGSVGGLTDGLKNAYPLHFAEADSSRSVLTRFVISRSQTSLTCGKAFVKWLAADAIAAQFAKMRKTAEKLKSARFLLPRVSLSSREIDGEIDEFSVLLSSYFATRYSQTNKSKRRSD